MTSAWNFVAMIEDFFLIKSFIPSTIDPCLGFQSFPDRSRKKRDKRNFSRALQHHIDFTPLDHQWPLFFKSCIIYFTYFLQNMIKWKNSHLKKLSFFFNFLFSCKRIPEVAAATGKAYENARRGWTLLFTTSLVACNHLKIPFLKTYARRPSL